MPLPLAVADVPAFAMLGVYLALIAAAAFAGGSSVAFLSLTHRQMQVALSLTGGVLLGVGLLHLLPHAIRRCNNMWPCKSMLQKKVVRV